MATRFDAKPPFWWRSSGSFGKIWMFAQLGQQAWTSKIIPLTSSVFVAICGTSTSLSIFIQWGRGGKFVCWICARPPHANAWWTALTIIYYVYLVCKLHISKYNTGKSPANRQTPQSQQPASRPANPLCFSGKLCFFYVIALVISLWGM